MDQQSIRQYLFSNYTQLYCVLDGVMVPDLPERLYRGQVPNHCLLTGDLPADAVHAAPYLVYLSPDSKFADWVLEEALGKHWGVFVQSPRSMLEMRRHFRALLQAYDERGNPLKFRFYDPRVLSKFLPTCNGGELRTLFGEVQAFYAESEDGSDLVRYRIQEGKLSTTVLNKES
jgi:hypothetical protein